MMEKSETGWGWGFREGIVQLGTKEEEREEQVLWLRTCSRECTDQAFEFSLGLDSYWRRRVHGSSNPVHDRFSGGGRCARRFVDLRTLSALAEHGAEAFYSVRFPPSNCSLSFRI